MSDGGELVRFDDWRAARDRKAALALPLHRAGGGACLDWACAPGAAGRHVILLLRQLTVAQKFGTGY